MRLVHQALDPWLINPRIVIVCCDPLKRWDPSTYWNDFNAFAGDDHILRHKHDVKYIPIPILCPQHPLHWSFSFETISSKVGIDSFSLQSWTIILKLLSFVYILIGHPDY
jgi:hypothetical protein